MKKILILLSALMLLVCGAAAEESVNATAELSHISKYGNIKLDIASDDFIALGYEFGDVVSISFLNKTLKLPFCFNYSDVDSGAAALFARSDEACLSLAINMGDFATTNGIAVKTTNEDKSFFWTGCEGVGDSVTFSISMAEKRGYYEQYILHGLTASNERTDYPNLTDEQYANFRAVTTTGMGNGVLYRTSSPVNPKVNRNKQANAACVAADITVIMNLSDSEKSLAEYEYGEDNIYRTAKYIALNMGMDFTAEDFRMKLADGLRFLAANDGIYAVHCNEGKDRSGFVVAILECLMGATYEEVTADYMVSYANYHGVMPGDARYDVILNSNIITALNQAFNVQDLKSANLSICAEHYLLNIGMTIEEIARLRTNLAD